MSTQEGRPDPADWLALYGWATTETSGDALAERYHRAVSPECHELLGQRSSYVTARHPARTEGIS